jgi:hypothetical protein
MNMAMVPMWVTERGVFFVLELPDAVQPFIQVLPLTALIDALRSVVLDGAGIAMRLARTGDPRRMGSRWVPQLPCVSSDGRNTRTRFAEQSGSGVPVEERDRMRANADRKWRSIASSRRNAATQGNVPAIAGAGINAQLSGAQPARQCHGAGPPRAGVSGGVGWPLFVFLVTRNAPVVLLGVLKAGGSYVLLDPATAPLQWPRGVYFADKANGDEIRYRMIDISPALTPAPLSSANLPIVVRGNDVACVIADSSGTPAVLVLHSTIMSLKRDDAPRFAEWSGDPGALDLWAALMSGATVTLSAPALRSAA